MLKAVTAIAEHRLKQLEACLHYPVEIETRTTGFAAYDLPCPGLICRC